MSLTKADRDRIAIEHRVVATARARWKVLKQGDYHIAPPYRAICGKPGCAGSLGLFEAFRAHPKDLASVLAMNVELAREVLGVVESMVATAREVVDRTNLEPDVRSDQAKERREHLAELESLQRDVLEVYRLFLHDLEEYGRAVASGQDHLVKSPTFLGSEGCQYWTMQPEAGHGEPGSKGQFRSLPIYYGHRTSGFRISIGGKRTAEGHRVSRRPYRRHFTEEERLALGRWEDDRHVAGQQVLPPCLIICAVCGTINWLSLPFGASTRLSGRDKPTHPTT